jgi:hypothetical protein
LPAVETLGSTTVICSDKTGTLTENAMTVRVLWCGGEGYALSGHGYSPEGDIRHDEMAADMGGALRECLVAGALCNDASLRSEHGRWLITGDPTEAALLVAARKGGLDEHTLNALLPRVDVLPFDACRQFMATAHAPMASTFSTSRAPWNGCSRYASINWPATGAACRSSQRHRTRRTGLCRTGHARAAAGPPPAARGCPAHRGGRRPPELIGLVGMIDPPRKAVIAAIRNCHSAGIRVKMITGDHAVTALAIARQIGLDAGRALTGRELAGLDDAALAEAAHASTSSPASSRNRSCVWSAPCKAGRRGGDDRRRRQRRPGLKQADIGVAMGLGGTEVAKEPQRWCSPTTTSPASKRRSRRAGASGTTWSSSSPGRCRPISARAGHRRRHPGRRTLPITPLQILWINMTTAVLLGLPLAFEPIEKASCTARRAASTAGARRGADPAHRARLLLLLAGAFGLFLRELAQGHSLAEARTVAVNVFVMVEAAYLFNCRSLTRASGSRAVFQPVDMGRGGQHDAAATGDDLPGDEPTVRHGPDRGSGMAGNHPRGAVFLVGHCAGEMADLPARCVLQVKGLAARCMGYHDVTTQPVRLNTMSKALQSFEFGIKDADELLAHFDAINANPPPANAEVLKRAGLVMALTAWETYVEDRLTEEMGKKLAAVSGSYVGDFVLKKLHHDLKQFHNPNSDKTRRIFLEYLGLDVTEGWAWANFDPEKGTYPP